MSEVVLDPKILIVSETDTSGVIRYINSDFCRVSGFCKEDLVGSTHSIIRHPDMPKIAFENLWRTIKRGEIWKGFVKNKTKNGDYYWVFATVFPISSVNGDGYLSVRTKANSHEIEKYEALYKEYKMREK